MSRLFDDAQSEYLEVAQAGPGYPFVMACWYNQEVGGPDYSCLMSIGDASEDTDWFRLIAYPTQVVYIQAADTGAARSAVTSTSFTEGVWCHVCTLLVSATDRRIWLDGGGFGNDNENCTPAGLDRTAIGRFVRQNPGNYAGGMIAEASIWDLSDWPGATASDKANNFEKILPSLVKGFSPLFYPLGLIAYWDLVRGLSSKVGQADLTASGTIVAPHPRIILPWSSLVPVKAGVSVTVTPSTFELALTQQAPSLHSSYTATPSTLELALSLKTPVASISKTVTPDTLALALVLQAPSVTGGVVVTPATLALALALEVPSLSFDFTGFMGYAFPLELTLHAPTIVIPTDVTVTPDTLQLLATFHAPEITARLVEIPPFMQKDMIEPYSGGAWLWLVEIAVPGYDTQDLARNTENVRYAGKDFDKWNFEIGKQTFAGDGSIPRVVLQVGQDPDLVIEDIVNASEGCHDGTVKLIRVNEKFLDYEVEALEVNYGILVADSDAEWIYLTLGIPNPLTQRIPLRIGSSKICPWKIPGLFKGPRCQYTGADASCKGTLDDCNAKGNAHHWGAEIGLDPNVTRV